MNLHLVGVIAACLVSALKLGWGGLAFSLLAVCVNLQARDEALTTLNAAVNPSARKVAEYQMGLPTEDAVPTAEAPPAVAIAEAVAPEEKPAAAEPSPSPTKPSASNAPSPSKKKKLVNQATEGKAASTKAVAVSEPIEPSPPAELVEPAPAPPAATVPPPAPPRKVKLIPIVVPRDLYEPLYASHVIDEAAVADIDATEFPPVDTTWGGDEEDEASDSATKEPAADEADKKAAP